MIISINIEDKKLLAQLLNDLGKKRLIEMVEELENDMIGNERYSNEQETPLKTNEDNMEEPLIEETDSIAPNIDNAGQAPSEHPFNGACRYNPEFSCSAPEPENCILCPRYSSGNEF